MSLSFFLSAQTLLISSVFHFKLTPLYALGPGCKSSMQIALDPERGLQQQETITSGNVIALVVSAAATL